MFFWQDALFWADTKEHLHRTLMPPGNRSVVRARQF
jgi:hypothetical protein